MRIRSSQTVSPQVWGRTAWEFLEMLIMTYPVSDPPYAKRDAVLVFLENMGDLLPCGECTDHYKKFIENEALGDVVQSREKFFDFYHRLRSDVSRRMNKPVMGKEQSQRQIMEKFKMTTTLQQRPPVRSITKPSAEVYQLIQKNTPRGCACRK